MPDSITIHGLKLSRMFIISFLPVTYSNIQYNSWIYSNNKS